MSAQTRIFLLFIFSFGWSNLSFALRCAPVSIEEAMSGIEVVAIARTDADVNTRRMTTIAEFKGSARESYYYDAELVNPVPTVCCIELQPNTDYLIYASDEEKIGYSFCGKSEGVQGKVEPNNGAPPFSMFLAYPYFDEAGQKLFMKMLTTLWPEVQKKWVEEYDQSIKRESYSLPHPVGVLRGGDEAMAWYKEKNQRDPEERRQAEANLRASFQEILSKWQPIIVEHNLDSPYLSEEERTELKVKNIQAEYAKKYDTDDEAELLKIRHKNGEISDFEYEFYRDLCRRIDFLDYCSIFE